jgi:hypothetical protein
MSAIVTVFKSELEEKTHLVPVLIKLSKEVKELNDAYVYRPRTGSLMQFLTLLNEKDISYGTHFNSMPDEDEGS